ncbi:hypothetical protein LY76DRAFT_397706 [Colletotrichum caudatum]|nr:hypothetical protein LY76DRAFT_397706 [Colletotrichum caudatum]
MKRKCKRDRWLFSLLFGRRFRTQHRPVAQNGNQKLQTNSPTSRPLATWKRRAADPYRHYGQ